MTSKKKPSGGNLGPSLRSPAWGSRLAEDGYNKRSRSPGVPLSMAAPPGGRRDRSPHTSPGLGGQPGKKSPKTSPAVAGMTGGEPPKNDVRNFENDLHSSIEFLDANHDTRKLTAIMASNQVPIVPIPSARTLVADDIICPQLPMSRTSPTHMGNFLHTNLLP